MIFRFNTCKLVLLILYVMFMASSALGQIYDPPPEVISLDENGVSIPSGVNIIEQRDVAIGPAKGGLSLTRYINGWSQRSNLVSDLMIYRGNASPGSAAIAAFGNSSDVFIASKSNVDVLVSSYSKNGTTATLTLENQTPVYTTTEGVKIYFNLSPIQTNLHGAYYLANKAVFPNGEVWNWSWKTGLNSGKASGVRLQGVENNLGYQVKFTYKTNSLIADPKTPWLDFDKVTAVNLAYEFCDSSLDSCVLSQEWPIANYSTSWSPGRIETVVAPVGRKFINKWAPGHMYVQTPSSSSLNIDYFIGTDYDCTNDVDTSKVWRVDKNGSSWIYSWILGSHDCLFGQRTLKVKSPNNKETVYTYTPMGRNSFNGGSDFGLELAMADPAQLLTSTDSEGHLTRYEYDSNRIKKITMPELDSWEFTYDARGNVLNKIRHAKPGSGQPDIVLESRTYPPSCTSANYRVCNKPLTVTDANRGVTVFAYDPAHGGVLTETSPSVGGVAAVKRYSYVQKYAWIKNSSGTYVQASSPVWLLAEERFCKSSATTGNGCSGGAADEVVTSYDYGPSSGPNNLLLRGVAITADGVTKRSCYTYNSWGNPVSQTSPRAGLASCY